jgi:hypothetical protein
MAMSGASAATGSRTVCGNSLPGRAVRLPVTLGSILARRLRRQARSAVALALALLVVSAVLLVACGPNATPRLAGNLSSRPVRCIGRGATRVHLPAPVEHRGGRRPGRLS